jgi:hypothetical protein
MPKSTCSPWKHGLRCHCPARPALGMLPPHNTVTPSQLSITSHSSAHLYKGAALVFLTKPFWSLSIAGHTNTHDAEVDYFDWVSHLYLITISTITNGVFHLFQPPLICPFLPATMWTPCCLLFLLKWLLSLKADLLMLPLFYTLPLSSPTSLPFLFPSVPLPIS